MRDACAASVDIVDGQRMARIGFHVAVGMHVRGEAIETIVAHGNKLIERWVMDVAVVSGVEGYIFVETLVVGAVDRLLDWVETRLIWRNAVLTDDVSDESVRE